MQSGEFMLIVFTVMAIIGAICVARDKALMANCLWAVSNLAFIANDVTINQHGIIIDQYEMVLLFGVYEVIALYGIWNMTRNREVTAR